MATTTRFDEEEFCLQQGGDMYSSQKQQQLSEAEESSSRSGRATAYDYVFFDWKGTLAMKGNLGSHQRAQLR